MSADDKPEPATLKRPRPQGYTFAPGPALSGSAVGSGLRKRKAVLEPLEGVPWRHSIPC